MKTLQMALKYTLTSNVTMNRKIGLLMSIEIRPIISSPLVNILAFGMYACNFSSLMTKMEFILTTVSKSNFCHVKTGIGFLQNSNILTHGSGSHISLVQKFGKLTWIKRQRFLLRMRQDKNMYTLPRFTCTKNSLNPSNYALFQKFKHSH